MLEFARSSARRFPVAALALFALCAAAGCGRKADEKAAAPAADPALPAVAAFIESMGVETQADRWRTRLPRPPRVEFSAAHDYFWRLETSKGEVVIQLMPAVAPMHVSSTIYLTTLGFYDGLGFHRIIPGFMAQGGCPEGTGRGGPGYTYGGEFSAEVRHDRPGLLSMANAGPNTDGSQFFLTFVPTPHLDDRHTIFGEVVEGMATLEAMAEVGSQSGAPSEEVVLEKATIEVRARD
jgi:peptidyl-prolyl cis-trans isomerase B (cyclophilin B)